MPTANGFLYLAVVLDAWSRKIVGWAMATHLRAELVVEALEMAVGQRRPGDVIHHSDQGSLPGFNLSSQHLAPGGKICERRHIARQVRYAGRTLSPFSCSIRDHSLAPTMVRRASRAGAVHDAAQRHRRSQRAASWTAPSTVPGWQSRDPRRPAPICSSPYGPG